MAAGSATRARQSWARLLADVRGNVSVVLGFCAIGLVGGVGIAIDTSVAYNVRSQLASAVDAAALAGARAFASPTRDDDIQNFFDANFQAGYMGSVLQPLEIVPNNEERTVTVTARATIPTYFMRVLGRDSTDISATAEATLSSRDVEVALVLDVTGSMEADMDDLRAAANELVDIVVQDLQVPFYSKIALVPYSAAVNVGDYANQIRGSYTSGTCDSPGCRYFEFEDATWRHNSQTHEISTCVTERPGPDLSTDDAPSLAPLGPAYLGDGNPCLAHEILPLTSNKTELHNRINALTHEGSTAGHLGVAWGWYLVSPNFGYLWPVESQPKEYGEIHLGQKVMKVVIVMTDGAFNTIYHDGVIAKNSGSGSGSSDEKINENGTNGSSFEQAEALCTNMKAEGVIVYTVGFADASTGDAADFVEGCATSPDHVYLPSTGTDLIQAFRDIAVQVSNLRISM
jgi:Flp pilus assembly protein TadG